VAGLRGEHRRRLARPHPLDPAGRDAHGVRRDRVVGRERERGRRVARPQRLIAGEQAGEPPAEGAGRRRPRALGAQAAPGYHHAAAREREAFGRTVVEAHAQPLVHAVGDEPGLDEHEHLAAARPRRHRRHRRHGRHRLAPAPPAAGHRGARHAAQRGVGPGAVRARVVHHGAERGGVAVGHLGVLAVAGGLEHGAGEVAQRRARRAVERVAAVVDLLEAPGEAARLDGRAVQVARVQVAERGVVVGEQPLVVARHVGQRAVVGGQRQGAARHALGVAVVGHRRGPLERQRALVPAPAVVGRRAAVELAEQHVRRPTVLLAPRLPERGLPSPHGERVAQPLLADLEPRRGEHVRSHERTRGRRAAAGDSGGTEGEREAADGAAHERRDRTVDGRKPDEQRADERRPDAPSADGCAVVSGSAARAR
jgi:hypothetical protein